MADIRENQRQVIEDEPHGEIVDDKGKSWNVWCGTRRTDEQTSAVGFYRWYPVATDDDSDALRLEFRPLISRLRHEQAALFADEFAQEMNGEIETLKELAEALNKMSHDQREALIYDLKRFEHVSPDLEL